MSQCFSCQSPLPDYLLSGSVGRSETCARCHSDVRCCKNCQYYDLAAEWQCREHIPEPVKEKERANFCELFQLKKSAAGKGDKKPSGRDDLLKAAEALFKK